MMLDNQKTLKKVALHTLGCRLNFSETGSIAQGFVDRGFEIVELGSSPADVVFLNTCTVTDGADSTCRQLIRKTREQNPKAKIVVAGCYAQMEAEKIKENLDVDLILGTQEKYKVFDHLHLSLPLTDSVHIDRSEDFWGATTSLADSHTRAFLKIQDGCNYVCSFCIIPFARGRSRTITVEDAVNETRKLIDLGFKEIVLTGVNIGEYERTSGEKLSHLLENIIKVPGLRRLRLSSVEPNTITDELLSVLKGSGIYQDHFHVPLQSGSDTILKSMRRKYTIGEYEKIIQKIKTTFPKAAIGADIIAGYPGETEKEFSETFNYLRESAVTHFHVFPYSKRKGTTAEKLSSQVSSQEKKERVKTLIHLGQVKLDEFSRELLGTTQEVLFENSGKDNNQQGYIPHFIKVEVKSELLLKNQIRLVKLQSYLNGKFKGTLINE